MQIGADKSSVKTSDNLTMPQLVRIIEHCHLPVDGGSCDECLLMQEGKDEFDYICIGVREMSRKFGLKVAELYYFEKMKEGL